MAENRQSIIRVVLCNELFEFATRLKSKESCYSIMLLMNVKLVNKMFRTLSTLKHLKAPKLSQNLFILLKVKSRNARPLNQYPVGLETMWRLISLWLYCVICLYYDHCMHVVQEGSYRVSLLLDFKVIVIYSFYWSS